MKKALIISILCLFIASAASAWVNTYPHIALPTLRINSSLSSEQYTNDPNVILHIWTQDCNVAWQDNTGVHDFWKGQNFDLLMWEGEPIVDPTGPDPDLPDLLNSSIVHGIGSPFFDLDDRNEGWTSTQIAPPNGLTLTLGEWTLSPGDGPKKISGIVCIFASIGQMNNYGVPFITWISESFSRTIILDTQAPSNGSIIINKSTLHAQGDPYATSPTVDLEIWAEDENHDKMKVWNENQNSNQVSWIDYVAEKTQTLSAGDGSKTVSIKFMDKAGNISTTYSDAIILDTQAPTGSVQINDGAASTNTRAVTLNISASDVTSDVSEMHIRNSRQTSDGEWIDSASSDWEDYAATKDWSLSLGSDSIRKVRIQFKDVAGNLTDWIDSQEEIILDTTPPEPGNQPISIDEATSSNGRNFVNSPDVTLILDAEDEYHDIKMIINHSNESAEGGGGIGTVGPIGEIGPIATPINNWMDYAPTYPWILENTGLNTFDVKFSDSLGNADSIAYDYTVIYDPTAPTGDVSVVPGGHVVEAADGVIYANDEDNVILMFENLADNESATEDLRINITGVIRNWFNSTDEWLSYRQEQEVDLTYGDGPKEITVKFMDEAGNISSPETIIVKLDKTDPEVDLASPTPGNYTNIDYISGTASDPMMGDASSGIDKVQVRIRKNGSFNEYWDENESAFVRTDHPSQMWLDAVGATTWTYDCNSVAWEVEDYTIQARSIDKAGNVSSTSYVNNVEIISESTQHSAPVVRISTDDTDVTLSWTNTGYSYKVYRSEDEPYFAKNSAYLVASEMSTSWIHHGAAGNTSTNYYYFVVAVGPTGLESDPSNRVGKFSFELVHNDGIPSVNAVTIVLDPAQSDNPIPMNAEGLANAVPNCSSVAEWNAGTQSYIEHPAGVPFNNFETQVGHPYFVRVTADGFWTQVGGVPEEGTPIFNLIYNVGIPSVNAISIKLNRNDIVDAEGLANTIPNCSSVAEWNAETQSYIEHPAGVPFNNFSVITGYPYFVRMTNNATW